MIYIWLDESDKQGDYYSNFYGGILIKSEHLEDILLRAKILLDSLGIDEEIKWQKVNAYTFEKYVKIVDFIFELLNSDLAKIRIFFRNNQFNAVGLTKEQRRQEFPILYYQFIKHAFGLIYADIPDSQKYVRLYLDDIPLKGEDSSVFKSYIFRLNNDESFRRNKIHIRSNDIIEVDSAKHLPLQFLDLILGSMCFRLNNKHKLKDPLSGKRGRRTLLKERLYKYINSKIREIKPNFNIGESTGISYVTDKWYYPYSHWSFKPSKYVRDYSLCKPKK